MRIFSLAMSNIPGRKLYGYLLLLLIFSGCYSYGQRGCDDDSLFNDFKKNIQIELEIYRGRIKWDNETREPYYSLLATCPVQTLEKYIDDSIPVIRAEIFVNLLLKGASNTILKGILNKHINDTAKFISAPTDVVIEWKVNEYMQFLFSLTPRKKVTNKEYRDRLERLRSEWYIVIPGAYHRTISKESMLKVDSLGFSVQDYKIVGFTITVGEMRITTTNCFDQQLREAIGKLKPREKIFFDDIKAVGPDKRIRNLGTLTLRVI